MPRHITVGFNVTTYPHEFNMAAYFLNLASLDFTLGPFYMLLPILHATHSMGQPSQWVTPLYGPLHGPGHPTGQCTLRVGSAYGSPSNR